MLKIGIIIGSTRDGRLSPQVAEWTKSIADANTEAEFEIIDIKDYNLKEFNFYPRKKSPTSKRSESGR